MTTVADGDVTCGTKMINAYVADGSTDQSWEPYFTYHSGRYIEVRGLTEAPTPDTLTGIAVATDTTEATEARFPLELDGGDYQLVFGP